MDSFFGTMTENLLKGKMCIRDRYCITVDHQTLEDNCVTLRNRDTMQQERVAISELNIIADKVSITSLLKTLQ